MHQPRLNLRWQQADPLLGLASVALPVLGIILVTSATWQYLDPPSLLGNTWFLKQSLFFLLGLAAMIVSALIHPRVLRAFAYPIYALTLISLVIVLVIGHGAEEFGASRWIQVGGLPIQPSEAAKVTLVIVLAHVLASREPGIRSLIISAVLLAPMAFLIYLEPDLGTAMCLGVTWFGMIVLSGMPKRYVVAVAGLALISGPIVWFGLKDYMRERVLIFLNPHTDALGQGYNILQSQISVGSGGMWGKGLFEGTQTQLRYLRVSHSDFIFSVLGEELGFMGAMVLFSLILLFLFRALRAHDIAEDRFASLLCAGVSCLIGFQAVANLGANVGLTPVVGIPLPFVSYGGSALITQLACAGLVQATLLRRRRFRFDS